MGESKSKTYTITDIAKVCGVSVASISKYVKSHGLTPVETGQNNSKLFSYSDYESIRSYYKSKRVESKPNHTQSTKSDIIGELRNVNKQQSETIELLMKQLDEKDEQIKRQNDQIDNLTTAVGNVSDLTKQVASLTANSQQLQLAEKLGKATPDTVDNKDVTDDSDVTEKAQHGWLWRLFH